MILVAAIIGTGVTLYPVIKRQSESIALGYVCTRLLEAAVIVVGVVAMLSVVTMRQEAAGADAGTMTAVADALVAVHDWTFLLGPSLILGVNSLLLAFLMYRSALVPRRIALLGLVGGPLVAASGVAVLFGAYGQSVHTLTALPVFAWEVSLAVWMIARGFKPATVAATPTTVLDTDLALTPA